MPGPLITPSFSQPAVSPFPGSAFSSTISVSPAIGAYVNSSAVALNPSVPSGYAMSSYSAAVQTHLFYQSNPHLLVKTIFEDRSAKFPEGTIKPASDTTPALKTDFSPPPLVEAAENYFARKNDAIESLDRAEQGASMKHAHRKASGTEKAVISMAANGDDPVKKAIETLSGDYREKFSAFLREYQAIKNGKTLQDYVKERGWDELVFLYRYQVHETPIIVSALVRSFAKYSTSDVYKEDNEEDAVRTDFVDYITVKSYSLIKSLKQPLVSYDANFLSKGLLESENRLADTLLKDVNRLHDLVYMGYGHPSFISFYRLPERSEVRREKFEVPARKLKPPLGLYEMGKQTYIYVVAVPQELAFEFKSKYGPVPTFERFVPHFIPESFIITRNWVREGMIDVEKQHQLWIDMAESKFKKE